MSALRLAAFLALFSCLSFGRTAHAHDPFETTSVVSLHPDRVEIRMVAARATVSALFGADRDLTGATFPQEPALGRLYALSSVGRPLPLLRASASRGVEGEAAGDLVFDLVFDLQSARSESAAVRLRALYLEQLEQGYTGIVQVLAARSAEQLDVKVLHSSDPFLDVQLPDASAPPDPDHPPQTPKTRPHPLLTFLGIGLEHVVFGYDHLLFLLSVLLACRRFAQVLGVLTTFTLAHSVTLSLAALHLVPLVNHIVEPLIALSIAVAALFGQRLETRGTLLPLTFAFGLVHGLGFAAGLDSLADAGGTRAVALVGFNLGVELGQLAAALALLPLIRWCRKSSRGELTLTWTARIVGAVGAALFVVRVCYPG